MAKRLEPQAGLLLLGDRLYELGRVLGIIPVFILATELSDILNHRRCLRCWGYHFNGVMDHWRRSSISVPEDSKERHALMVMSEE